MIYLPLHTCNTFVIGNLTFLPALDNKGCTQLYLTVHTTACVAQLAKASGAGCWDI